MEFLASGGCDLIDVYKPQNEQKPLRFGRKGKLFYVKTIDEIELLSVILTLLAPLQKRILDKFTLLNRRIYYFSLYELKKLNASSGVEVDYAVERLTKLGLLARISIGTTDIFVKPPLVPKLELQMEEVLICEKIEFSLIKKVHELIMNLYPLNVITAYTDCIRPRTQETLTITGGMTFDLFYRFFEPIAGKSYLAVDIYTRIPVTGFTVYSFAKKIEWAETRTRKGSTNYLKEKTHGMIIYRNASKNAITIANKLGIRFLRLRDVKADYKSLRKEVKG